jgi:hypothetical protein
MAFTRKHENLVAAFRGFPKGNPRGRIKKTIGANELMGMLLEKHRLLTPRIENELMPQWGYVVGETNAHRCAPIKIERGVLRVGCAHPVLLREMGFNKKMILRRLQNIIPGIKDVRFVTG